MLERFNESYDRFIDSKTGCVLGWLWFTTLIFALIVGSVNSFG